LCEPTARPEYACGDAQFAKVALSSEHWKVEPGSDAVNWKDALVLDVVAGGFELMTVSGAVWSIVQE
jgi:hypothetical protein